MTTAELSRSQQDQLLRLACRAIQHPNEHCDSSGVDTALLQPGASFVTLTQHDQLRGCIGSLMAVQPLADDVWQNAQSAAYRDPRFPQLTPTEYSETDVEVSVLTSPEKVEFTDYPDLYAKIPAGEVGVIIESRGHRATFLPQVWSQLPTTEAFFSQLFRKAGLGATPSPADLSVWTYNVHAFSSHLS